ncbi:MAG TPA: tRNA (adenosine(37)-N6)-dimethylallyltransferase MiaA [Smithella sp.]|jgi:tRNA dimethylallyltransferase|nr:tRNA (adenosine(37)-N6)-dimethylallyltransferase MiaA [Smithella sp.]NMC97638.1 tRNA (adenosine(37)-N6)-dimethylallyltransferase MiaA [Deltaproteobacteria bacterium]OQC53262.1 MAG: tRNA dimethylallyltransferase [Deltaproteobacteria bacterium ADurb.Bin022]HNQ65541.1 tRNA (adenosine(37)-N6)-dimethylallyltransferase MiaA [Smithella sp.]HOG11037.1 tRNA (adenosine(37)-N6)-dimethylallyltransferase MiaA [Smithella sp.]
MAKNLIVILGPTASGKTRLAAQLACDFQGEVISADSRQVYRTMNIGTGKDLKEYVIDGRQIPYHLIDIEDPENEFNVFEFQKRFYAVFSAIRQRKKLPVLTGGTGLYLEAVLCAYDMPEAPINEEIRRELSEKSIEELQDLLCRLKPHLHNRTDLDDKKRLLRAVEIEKARIRNNQDLRDRPEITAAVFGVRWERSVLRNRITKRLEERLENGMIEEVADLHAAGLSWLRLESFGLEYRFISEYLQQRLTFDEMKNRLNIAIHQFAKRQETWFRRMERKGVQINWIDNGDYLLLAEKVAKHLK